MLVGAWNAARVPSSAPAAAGQMRLSWAQAKSAPLSTCQWTTRFISLLVRARPAPSSALDEVLLPGATATPPDLELEDGHAIAEAGVGARDRTLPVASHMCLAVDPDISGALAILRWRSPVSVEPREVQLENVDCEIIDIPHVQRVVASKQRRCLDVRALGEVVQEVMRERQDAAANAQPMVVHAVLEASNCIPGVNGFWSVKASGYSVGAWEALLHYCSFNPLTVTPQRWKADMGLKGQDKEASRSLARQLLPQAAASLKLKKHHGRAEALLLGVWRMRHAEQYILDARKQEERVERRQLRQREKAKEAARQQRSAAKAPGPGAAPRRRRAAACAEGGTADRP